MGTVLKTRLVKMGNSQGIRIPKPVLLQIGLTDEVEIAVEGEGLFIRPVQQPRQGWDSLFAQMAAAGEDQLLDADDLKHDWDDEWQW